MLTRPEWTDVELEPGYRLTLRVIGDGVVHSRPSGFVTSEGVRAALELIDRVLREGIPPGSPWVHLADYSGLRGASLEARRVFIEEMRDRSGLCAVVFCGASPVLRLSIRLARRLHIVRLRLALVDTYEEGARRAVEMLRARREVPGPDRGSPDQRRGEIPAVAGQRIERRAARIRYEAFDDQTLLMVVEGIIGLEDVDALVAHGKPLVSALKRRAGRAFLLLDLHRLDGLGRRARARLVEALVAQQPDMGLDLVVCFGASRLIQGVIHISRPLLPFPIRVARDLRGAVALVRDRRQSGDEAVPGPSRPHPGPSAGQVDQLLRFLANIDWEASGVAAAEPTLPPDNPLAPVCDAMLLVKEELDQLLHERRRAEEALRQSEERYRAIVDNILEGYYEVDLEGRVTFSNESLARILGYSAEEMIGLDSRSYMDRSDLRRVTGTFNQVYETGVPSCTLDWEFVRKDGVRIPVETSISLMVSSEGERLGFRGIVRDITARVAAERERERLQGQLRNAQRMEAIGRLAGGIAHNFNNLLMGIQGNVSLLAARAEPGGADHRRLETIRNLVEGGSRLTAQLLGCARAGRYDVRPLDLAELVRATAETFGLTKQEIRIQPEIEGDLPPALADRHQIEQVLLNLLINAAEAMPGGGALVVGCGRCSAQDAQERRPGADPVAYVTFWVRDAGVGMDAQTLERIFDPFFSTKGLSGGTGLGLASAYGIIEAHGGFIEVASTPGEGTVFTVFLPAAEGAEPTPDEPAPPLVRGLGRVLVVEDDEAVMEASLAMLELLHYVPIRAACGQEAIEIFEEQAGRIDLVVLDLILPDMSGEEVLRSLRRISPSVRVLLSSGYSLEGEAGGTPGRGCRDFIQKPYTLEALSEKLSALMACDVRRAEEEAAVRPQGPGSALDSR